MDDCTTNVEPVATTGARIVMRHRVSTRVWHWINAIAVIVLLMSGLMISNAHPRLYWGQYGANFDHAWLELPHFPGWATIPSSYSLSGARRWHLAFAWVFAVGLILYLMISLLNRHAQRDLAPTTRELAPRAIWQDIVAHARLHFPTGEDALRYNVLQKLSYFGVLFLVLPLLILTGLAMSPAMGAAWPWLLEIFGGRPSARSIHFICATAMALFIAVHLLMVLLSGPISQIRSMITGRHRIDGPEAEP